MSYPGLQEGEPTLGARKGAGAAAVANGIFGVVFFQDCYLSHTEPTARTAFLPSLFVLGACFYVCLFQDGLVDLAFKPSFFWFIAVTKSAVKPIR